MEIKDLVKECNLYEKIILKVHKKLFTKVSNNIRIEIVNKILK